MVKHSSSSDESSTRNPGETVVQFGTVAAGFTAEKIVYLHNLSPVNAAFQVLQPSSISNLEKVFSCSQYHGTIAPNSTAKIKVTSLLIPRINGAVNSTRKMYWVIPETVKSLK